MSDQDEDQKTEEPTERKLDKAREQGDVPLSQEVRTWFMLLGTLIVVAVVAPWGAQRLSREMKVFFGQIEQYPINLESIRGILLDLAWHAAIILAPVVIIFIILAFVGTLSQVGFMFTPKKLAPDFKKIDPIKGAKKMFSFRSIMELLKGIVKISIVIVVGLLIVAPSLRSPDQIINQSMLHTIVEIHQHIVDLVLAVVVVISAVAAFDLAYQRFQHTKKMRMTKQEVKDEHKDTDGDPHVKGRLRALRQERARQRMMANVPNADVVITNPTHYSIALQYDMEAMAAPKLIAKGVDDVAFRIREVAEENDIPIVENPPVARALYASVDLEEEVPPEHYKAVAEVISYVMQLKGHRVQ
jgi:flagellar biosynthetic protein FlhB